MEIEVKDELPKLSKATRNSSSKPTFRWDTNYTSSAFTVFVEQCPPHPHAETVIIDASASPGPHPVWGAQPLIILAESYVRPK